MTTAIVNIGTLIRRSPSLHGGVPHIAGKGVTVRRIAFLAKQGLNAEEIGEEIDHLSLAEIHAALSYYYANPDEIDKNLEVEAAIAKQLEQQYNQPGLAK